MVFTARVRVYDIKENFKRKYDGDLNCPFCRQLHENLEHIFQCNSVHSLPVSEKDNTVRVGNYKRHTKTQKDW